MMLISILLFFLGPQFSASFSPHFQREIVTFRSLHKCFNKPAQFKMAAFDSSNIQPTISVDNFHWIQNVYRGLADSSIDATTTTVTATPEFVCPGFGQPGWGPFCFLNGNPVFKAFDQFQAFIEGSVVTLHDGLQSIGIENAYGPSIILFTIFIRLILLPINYKQLASTQMIQALNPKVQEIKEKYPDDKNMQNQMTALLYEKAKANPLAGCLPAIVQVPVFVALYRSFQDLALGNNLREPFLWIPNLAGPVFGERNNNWLFENWHDNAPALGWSDTLAYLSLPIMLYFAQSLSLKILTPPSEDPTVQRTQQILKYLPVFLAYLALSVPAGLGIYWVINNLLSTLSNVSIKEYFKKNPIKVDMDLDKMMKEAINPYYYPEWGYKSEEDMINEAKVNYRPSRSSIIPPDFM